MVEILSGIVSFGFGLVSIIFNLLIALVVGVTMSVKGRSGLLWGIAAFFVPWIILVVFIIPRKIPKFRGALRHHPDFVGRNPVVASIMALSAIVAKSDGTISREEIQMIRNFVARNFRISATELNSYEGAFNYGKENPESHIEFTHMLRQYNRRDIVMSVGYLLMTIAMHDQTYSEIEERIVKVILGGLGLGEYEYASMKRYFEAGGSQFGQGRQQGYRQSYGGYQGGMPREDLTEKYAKVLGVSKDADMSEIKKAYRKLAKEHHPDKMAQEGMPEDYMKYANQRIAEINEAYDYLKKLKS